MNPQEKVAYNQPTSEPTPKVQAAGIGGAITSIVIWGLTYFGKIDVPAEVGAALATLFAFAAAYMTKDRKPPEVVEIITKEDSYYKG